MRSRWTEASTSLLGATAANVQPPVGTFAVKIDDVAVRDRVARLERAVQRRQADLAHGLLARPALVRGERDEQPGGAATNA